MTDDITTAKELLEKERVQRQLECTERLNAILQELGCRLEAVVIIKNGQISSQVNVIIVE
jgi:predicted butyrate kinase (DUF1464 family)